MTATIFYYVGHLAHQYNINNKCCNYMLLALMFVFVIVGMIIGSPYFYALYFPNYTLNILAAISTTGLIYLICRRM